MKLWVWLLLLTIGPALAQPVGPELGEPPRLEITT